MTFTLELHAHSVDDTLRIGRAIGVQLQPGDVAALVGCLGAGKTHLIKGIALGLGVAEERLVNSPTFVLINEYVGRVPVHHVDVYRLTAPAQLSAIGFEDLCGDGVVLVEWADKVAGLIPPAALWVELLVVGETQRRLALTTQSEPLSQRLLVAGLDRV